MTNKLSFSNPVTWIRGVSVGAFSQIVESRSYEKTVITRFGIPSGLNPQPDLNLMPTLQVVLQYTTDERFPLIDILHKLYTFVRQDIIEKLKPFL
jgi:hypothetical protein